MDILELPPDFSTPVPPEELTRLTLAGSVKLDEVLVEQQLKLVE